MVTQPVKIPTTNPAVARVLPVVMTVGIVSAIAMNVRSQLKTHSATQDRFFAQYKNPQSEAVRQKVFDGAVEDPARAGSMSWAALIFSSDSTKPPSFVDSAKIHKYSLFQRT
ncbi:hypothetical protein TrVFT333_008053 [Trichoderma virens FT-333]|nr:hypothetical protein TrVFT333_008053 [Trichoderma virens FT-333]